jgi:hypothetical protein
MTELVRFGKWRMLGMEKWDEFKRVEERSRSFLFNLSSILGCKGLDLCVFGQIL